MDNVRSELGKKIKTLRQLKGFTQEELGEKAGLSYKFVGEIERGEVNSSLNSLIGIAKALGVNIGDLFPCKTDMLSQLAVKDIQLIKKALRLLSKAFSKT